MRRSFLDQNIDVWISPLRLGLLQRDLTKTRPGDEFAMDFRQVFLRINLPAGKRYCSAIWFQQWQAIGIRMNYYCSGRRSGKGFENYMTVTKHDIRRGAYYDSVVLMQLQRGLIGSTGVLDAGVVMATTANCELLAANHLLPQSICRLDDLLIVVKAENDASAGEAIDQVDACLPGTILGLAGFSPAQPERRQTIT